MIENGEITEKDAWKKYSDFMNLPRNYAAFMAEYRRITGIQLIKGTQLDKSESAF